MTNAQRLKKIRTALAAIAFLPLVPACFMEALALLVELVEDFERRLAELEKCQPK